VANSRVHIQEYKEGKDNQDMGSWLSFDSAQALAPVAVVGFESVLRG
jgi:hypothetical protein